MPTAKHGYWIDGKRVPSVTTVLSRFKESGGLIHWAWQLGQDGQDYRDVRDKAADAGTVAHAMVEAWLHGKEDVATDAPPEVVTRATNAFEQFKRWAKQSRMQVAQTEIPLVSKLHGYGGTPDAILVDGELSLGDWKSSNGVYSDYLAQLAAYGQLWNENYPDRPITGGYHLIRFDKEFAAFSHHWWGDLDVALEYFLHCRKAYDHDKQLKRMVGK